jgi:hypothetical protein
MAHDVPGVARRQRNVFGEGAVKVDTDNTSVNAEMAPACTAVAAAATDKMALTAYQIAYGNVSDPGADLDHFARELMAHGDWRSQGLLRPFVPRFDMQIGAADAGRFDPHQHIARPDDWQGNIDQFQPWTRSRFHKGFHQLPPTSPHCHTAARNGVEHINAHVRARNTPLREHRRAR